MCFQLQLATLHQGYERAKPQPQTDGKDPRLHHYFGSFGFPRRVPRAIQQARAYTRVHFSAQPEPFLSRKYTETTQRVPQKVLTSSRKVDECKPLSTGRSTSCARMKTWGCRGSWWSTSRRNVGRTQRWRTSTAAAAGAYTRPLFSST